MGKYAFPAVGFKVGGGEANVRVEACCEDFTLGGRTEPSDSRSARAHSECGRRDDYGSACDWSAFRDSGALFHRHKGPVIEDAFGIEKG